MSVPPWLLLLLLLSLALALAYQLATNRFGWRVLVYWGIAFLAAAVCEALAESANLNLTRVGDLRLLPDVAGGSIVLAALWFLGM